MPHLKQARDRPRPVNGSGTGPSRQRNPSKSQIEEDLRPRVLQGLDFGLDNLTSGGTTFTMERLYVLRPQPQHDLFPDVSGQSSPHRRVQFKR